MSLKVWSIPLVLVSGTFFACSSAATSSAEPDAGVALPTQPEPDAAASTATETDEAQQTDVTSPLEVDAGAAADAGEPQPAPTDEPGEPTSGEQDAGETPLEPDSGAEPAPEPGGDGGTQPLPDDVARRFFLPTPESTNTVAPKVVVDAAGGTHAAYPAYVGGRAFYAYCGENCTGSDDVQVVHFEVGDSVANVALALTAEGKPRLLISEFDKVYYATCDEQCGVRQSWNVTPVFEHDNEMEVTGQALALDALGRPRFLMHTYVATLGIGQAEPLTALGACDAGCDAAANWEFNVVSDSIWQYPELHYDHAGRLQVVAAEVLFEDRVPVDKLGIYAQCESECTSTSAFELVPLGLLFEDTVVKPSLALALDAQGEPRVAMLIEDDDETTPDGRYLAYAECAGACAGEGALNNWSAVLVSDNSAIRNGVDLALHQGSPRIAFTLDYNIGIYECETGCTNADWQLKEVEFASNLPPDDVFLFPSCSVGAWFLDSPALAITDGGALRIGYRAYDVSGALQPPLDPSKPRCTTGLDFTWSRLAALPSL